MKTPPITIPEGLHEVLLHACCAPCSSAIVEWMLAHSVRPIIFYYNPNIWPREEYEIRKAESKRHAEGLGLRWIDGDYDHAGWLDDVCGLEGEPERGRRCEQCFTLRLVATARRAAELGIRYFATTLASSRWKRLDQIERAGLMAQQTVPGTTFWAQNWRKGGLQERRNQLLRAYDFYNQQYCGCEFSVRGVDRKAMLRHQMHDAKQQHRADLPAWSAAVVDRLRERLSDSRVVMAYWPLPDEVDIRPLVDWLAGSGRMVLLPRVTGDETMELRRYTSAEDLAEGAFHIMEPTGSPFMELSQIDTVLVPGVAFDVEGHRLGRGRGYYDRFLATLLSPVTSHPSPHLLGLCFPFQLVPAVPAEAHDILMDEVVTVY